MSSLIFRERGRKIHVIRQSYDPNTKGNQQVSVAKLGRWNYALEEPNSLSEDEMTAVNSWISNQREERNIRDMQNTVVAASAIISRVSESLDHESAGITEKKAAPIRAEIKNLQRAIRRAVARGQAAG